MEESKNKKTIQVDLLRSSVSDHTPKVITWEMNTTNNHIYFNDEWNGEYENSHTG